MAEFVEFMDHILAPAHFSLTVEHNTIKFGLVLDYTSHLFITELSRTKLTKQRVCDLQKFGFIKTS